MNNWICGLQSMGSHTVGHDWSDLAAAAAYIYGLPWCLSGKESANVGGTGDMGLIPGLGRSSVGGNSNPLQYSYLGNPIDREAC